MELNLNEEITFPQSAKGHIIRDGFVFTAYGEPSNVYNTLVVRNPENAAAYAPNYPFSTRSLQEHIQLIEEHQIEKAIVFASSIDFLPQCTSLKKICILPAKQIDISSFSYSPLEKMTWVEYLSCTTIDDHIQSSCYCEMDYSSLIHLKEISICGKGHKHYENLPNLSSLSLLQDKEHHNLTHLSGLTELQHLVIGSCNTHSLLGLAHFSKIRTLLLEYNRNLQDLSSIVEVAPHLEHLRILNCPKVIDFSFLEHLHNLKYLFLLGKNSLPSVQFIRQMPQLQHVVIAMNVEDGDITPCLSVPYAVCKNKRHYNLKDKDLSKDRAHGFTGLYPFM